MPTYKCSTNEVVRELFAYLNAIQRGWLSKEKPEIYRYAMDLERTGSHRFVMDRERTGSPDAESA